MAYNFYNNLQGLQSQVANTPTGLSTEQQANMRARVGMQNQESVNNGVQSMAKGLGGTTSPLFAAQSARLQAGAGSSTAATMANVDQQNTQNQIANQQQNNSAQAQLSQQGLSARSQDLQNSQFNTGQANSMEQARLNLATSIFNGNHWYTAVNPTEDYRNGLNANNTANWNAAKGALGL
jgi:hypothetical protein